MTWKACSLRNEIIWELGWRQLCRSGDRDICYSHEPASRAFWSTSNSTGQRYIMSNVTQYISEQIPWSELMFYAAFNYKPKTCFCVMHSASRVVLESLYHVTTTYRNESSYVTAVWKVRSRFCHIFQDAEVQAQKGNIVTVVRKDMQGGSFLDRKEKTRNVQCAMKRNRIKSASWAWIIIRSSPDALEN
jgi:hypothetical protein